MASFETRTGAAGSDQDRAQREAGRLTVSSAKFGDVRGVEGPYRFASELVGCGEHGGAAACSPSAATSRRAHLPEPSRPSSCLTCSPLPPAMLSHPPVSMCVLSLCVAVEEREEVCLSLRLCACLWRRGCACFYGDGGGGLGVLEGAKGGGC